MVNFIWLVPQGRGDTVTLQLYSSAMLIFSLPSGKGCRPEERWLLWYLRRFHFPSHFDRKRPQRHLHASAFGHTGKAVSSLWCLLRGLSKGTVHLTPEPAAQTGLTCNTSVWHLNTFPYVSTGEVYSSFWIVICFVTTHCRIWSCPDLHRGLSVISKMNHWWCSKSSVNFLKNYFALPCVESQLCFSSCEVLFSVSSSAWESFLK